MRRLALLDGFRGFFLIFMLLNHLPFAGGLWLAEINHRNLGYVEDAQGFVFLSGIIIGLYYTRLLERNRAADMDAKLAARVRELCGYHLGLLVVVLVAALLIPGAATVWAPFMEEIFIDPAPNAAAAFILLYQPTYLDILPQYLLYLLASPILLRMVAAGRSRAILFGSVGLWLTVQLGWHLPLATGMQALGDAVFPGFVLRGHFNPLAWQILFVTGLLIGAAQARGRLDWTRWFGPDRLDIARLCAVALVILFAYKLANANDLIGPAQLDRFDAMARRSEFGPVYIANFAALAWLTAWLIVSGERSGSTVVRRLGRWLNGLFRMRFLVFLGQHSLQVYAWHVLLAFGLMALDGLVGPFGWLTKTVLAAAAVASLAVPAWLHARWQNRTAIGAIRTAP